MKRLFGINLTKFRKDCSGVAAIEFAIIAPVVIALLSGIIQFGFVLFIQNHMVDVARDSARQFAVGATTESETVDFAQAALMNWGVTYTIDITVPDPSIPTTDVDITISLPRSDAAIADILGLFQSGTLTATVSMLVE